VDEAEEGQRGASEGELGGFIEPPLDDEDADGGEDQAAQYRAAAQYLETVIEDADLGEFVHADCCGVGARCGPRAVHIISPAAGRMRPNTMGSGIFSTKRKRPVSTSRLTRMLVPKPKKAFQSPGVQSAGLLVVMTHLPC
jgi:hypothetical protein